jgi:hypothetical protein
MFGWRVPEPRDQLGLHGRPVQPPQARQAPLRLRWHYRSRHQSLIVVSNSQFYENKLFIVPSPFTQEAGMGLRFHHVPDGVFDSGNSGTNPVEAKILAEAIMVHAKYHSLRFARDRDRLRQAVLEDHGWIIHRILSTDWFQRPCDQLQKSSRRLKPQNWNWLEALNFIVRKTVPFPYL